MIRVKCTKCGTVLQVPDSMSGKRGRCQTCGAVIEVSSSLIPTAIDTADKKSVSVHIEPDALGQVSTASPSRNYPEIGQNAEFVRFGAKIIAFWGWFTLIVGALAVLVGIIAFIVGIFSDSAAGTTTAAGVASSVVSEGFWAVVGGALLIALAAFFKLVAYTCEAIRDHIVA